jgi:hypothetical protein
MRQYHETVSGFPTVIRHFLLDFDQARPAGLHLILTDAVFRTNGGRHHSAIIVLNPILLHVLGHTLTSNRRLLSEAMGVEEMPMRLRTPAIPKTAGAVYYERHRPTEKR